MSIVSIYTNSVYENLKPLYANWEPGRPVKLGDFGVMRGGTFIYLGNIKGKELAISFSETQDSARDQKFFTSQDSMDVRFYAKGAVPINGVVNAKATLEVNFLSQDAVFFNAAECEYLMIEDKVALGKTVMDKYANDVWKREWVVVTDLVKAGATTIAVSAGKSASIVFEAIGDTERINLADASVGLAIKSSSNVGYQVVAAQGLIPLIGLCGIQSTFLWWGDDFKPLSRRLSDVQLLNALEHSPRVRTEESKEALYFGQLK